MKLIPGELAQTSCPIDLKTSVGCRFAHSRNITTMQKSIAIVGAGVAGAVCANQLALVGHAVTVFDKGRGPGGRTSSRRTDSGRRFDHGASRIDVSTAAMHHLLGPAVMAGVIQMSSESYTSSSGLNALCKWLLDGVPAHYTTKIVRIERSACWTLQDESGRSHGPFDVVILAVPPVNAAEILSGVDADLARAISSVQMLPRWVAMLGFADKQSNVPDHLVVGAHVFRRSKSNSVGDAFVVEASQDWSVDHVELDAAIVGRMLHEQVQPVLGSVVPETIAAHRWRYAFAERPLGRPFLVGESGLFVCGDWCLGVSVESACLSALAVVEAMKT